MWPVKKKPPTFNDTELFCVQCYTHDHYWSGGGSAGIDICPKCGSSETIAWINMNVLQRAKAVLINPELYTDRSLRTSLL